MVQESAQMQISTITNIQQHTQIIQESDDETSWIGDDSDDGEPYFALRADNSTKLDKLLEQHDEGAKQLHARTAAETGTA